MDQVVGSSDEKDDEPMYDFNEEVNKPITPQSVDVRTENVATSTTSVDTSKKERKVQKAQQQHNNNKNCNQNKIGVRVCAKCKEPICGNLLMWKFFFKGTTKCHAQVIFQDLDQSIVIPQDCSKEQAGQSLNASFNFV